jgi:excisionase family DNA binding protein
MKPARSADPTPQALSVKDAAKALGVSEATVGRLRKLGKLESIRLGSRVLVPVASIDRVLAGG